MSTPEILMLLSVLPKALRECGHLFSEDERRIAERLLRELRGQDKDRDL